VVPYTAVVARFREIEHSDSIGPQSLHPRLGVQPARSVSWSNTSGNTSHFSALPPSHENTEVTVRSPKTEHHAGGESRVIPLFPELRPYLEECFDLAEPGREYVITRYRDTNANLRTQLLRIIQRAGLQRWPKLFQNLRSTRETELAEDFPMHVVCQWIGNSQPIAAKHYLQVTDDHFTKSLQNALQHPAVLPRTGSQPESAAQEKTPVLQGSASGCDVVPVTGVPPQGLEQSENSPRRVHVSETAGAKSGAVDRENAPITPDLASVIDAWHTLPPDTRTAILAIVEAAHGR
jgi:hypothetical protein